MMVHEQKDLTTDPTMRRVELEDHDQGWWITYKLKSNQNSDQKIQQLANTTQLQIF